MAEKKTVADQLAEIQLENALKQQKILDAQLVKAELDNDEALESNAKRLAEKAVRRRQMEERQTNLHHARQSHRETTEKCEHFQGAPFANPLEGGDETQSILVVTRMPDGWSRLIYCANCHGRFWTPHPRFMRVEPFKAGTKMPSGIILAEDESAAHAEARVAKYYADVERFEALLKKAKKKKSELAKVEGDSGTTTTNRLKGTGEQVFPWRACDEWPLFAPHELEKKAA